MYIYIYIYTHIHIHKYIYIYILKLRRSKKGSRDRRSSQTRLGERNASAILGRCSLWTRRISNHGLVQRRRLMFPCVNAFRQHEAPGLDPCSPL